MSRSDSSFLAAAAVVKPDAGRSNGFADGPRVSSFPSVWSEALEARGAKAESGLKDLSDARSMEASVALVGALAEDQIAEDRPSAVGLRLVSWPCIGTELNCVCREALDNS